MAAKTKSPDRSAYELPPLQIRKLEIQTLNLFNDKVIAPLAPELTLNSYLTPDRDKYGLGGMKGQLFIHDYPALKLRIFAGKKEGKDIRTVRISPITEDDFPDSYRKAINRHRTRGQFDVLKIDQFQKINELVDCYQVMFKGDFKKPELNFQSVQSKDYNAYMRNHKKDRFNYLDKLPPRYHHFVDVDVAGYNFRKKKPKEGKPISTENHDILERMRHFQTSLFWFSNKIDLIDPLYDELHYKHNIVKVLAR